MSITYKIDQRAERITLTVAGDLRFHDLRTTLGVMVRDPDFHRRFDRLWDLQEAHTKLSGDDMRELATSVRDEVGGNLIAIVAPSDLAYGLARMYAALVVEAGITVRPSVRWSLPPRGFRSRGNPAPHRKKCLCGRLPDPIPRSVVFFAEAGFAG